MRRRNLFTIFATVTTLGACGALAMAAPAGYIYPKAGAWKGFDKHGHHKQTFKVALDEKHVYDFKLHIPYTCALNTPPGVIRITRGKQTKINAYNGYFSIHGSNLAIAGFTSDLSYSFNGFFSDKGRHATLAKGEIGVDFDTQDGDICNDRFDTWKGGHT
jgi:hypothetical protein